MTREILIIGGGLSGLHTAYELHRRGVDFLLLEARDRLGGRILSHRSEPAGEPPGGFDLGPAWFWPGQRRIAELIDQLELASAVVDQWAEGRQLVENGPGSVLRGDFGLSMAGSYRLRGGMRQLIDALARELPPATLRLATRATRLSRRTDGVELEVEGADGSGSVLGRHAVIAGPPRVALKTLRFEPELPAARRLVLQSIPTWMAGQGKCVALYERPFWRQSGLSGDAVSYVGPLGEIHDVTPGDDSPAALFGFFGVAPPSRRDRGLLERACLDQLKRLFGEAAAHPSKVLLKDWAFDPWTATVKDLEGPAVHSLARLPEPSEPGWNGRLHWSGSETASPAERNNGYLEGALEASWRTIESLLSHCESE